MLREPTENTIPLCWGRGPDDSQPTCKDCRERFGCRQYALDRTKCLFELNEETKDEEVKPVTYITVPELSQWATEMSERYGIRAIYGLTAKEKIAQAIKGCQKSGIDPKVWIEAQFHALGAFFKRQGMSVPKNCFYGGKAAERYQKFITETGLEATGNVRKQAATISKFSEAEFEYGHAVVVLGLTGKALEHFEESIKARYPDWDKDDWESIREARICAAVSILDMLLPKTSLQLCPPDRPWEWGELPSVLSDIAPC
jgi:hypothetical protein